MHVYLHGRAASRPRPSQQPKPFRRRYSPEIWAGLRAAIDRQHAGLAKTNPSSPRIRVSLAPVGWVLR